MLKNFRLSLALATLTLVSSLGVASKASADTATVTISETVPSTCLFGDSTPGTLGYNIASKTLNTASGTGSPTTGSISVLCNTSGSISISSVTPSSSIPATMTQSSLTATIRNGTNTATHNGTTSSGTITLASGTQDITVELDVIYDKILAPGSYSYEIGLTATP